MKIKICVCSTQIEKANRKNFNFPFNCPFLVRLSFCILFPFSISIRINQFVIYLYFSLSVFSSISFLHHMFVMFGVSIMTFPQTHEHTLTRSSFRCIWSLWLVRRPTLVHIACLRPSPFRHGAPQCTDYVLCAVPFSFVVDIVIVVARISVAIVVVVKWPTYSVCVDHIDRLLSIDRSRLQRATLVAAATQQMHTVHRV